MGQDHFAYLANQANSRFSILFAADDFCTENFFSVLLRQALENNLDGVIANTVRGVNPFKNNTFLKKRNYRLIDVERLTRDQVEGFTPFIKLGY